MDSSIQQFGVLIRLGWYFFASIIGICVMSLVPRGKTLVSNLGQRTISVYFYHTIIIRIFIQLDITNYRLYEGLILSIICVLVFSIKYFAIPLEKILKIKLFDKNQNNKNDIEKPHKEELSKEKCEKIPEKV